MKKIRNVYTLGETVPTEVFLDKQIQFQQQDSFYDSYTIDIQKPLNITITYGTERSKDYALETIQYLMANQTMQYGTIEDGPQFVMRGIIEGFYGEPWSHEDRLDAISFLQKHRMNTYMYAPKDDAFHRHKWREPYPKDEFSKLCELIKSAQQKHIDFYFCISPGNDFNYTLQEDFDILFTKIQSVIQQGVTHFCLLLDDINYELKGEDLERFKTPGKAHAYISNQLNEYLKTQLKDVTLVMCPTEYWQNTDSPYRQDLRNDLDSDIKVFWTGYKVVAKIITNQDGRNAQSWFGHDIVLWDNYPVNDMAQDLLFMGPLINRGDELHHSLVGMVSNPMIPWSLSKIPIQTMSDYMWDPPTYDPEQSYQQAILDLCGQDVERSKHLKIILENFRPSIISHYRNEPLETIVNEGTIQDVLDYYQLLEQSIEVIQQLPQPRFLAQLKPWIDRLYFDQNILQLYHHNNLEELQKQFALIPDKKQTIQTNYALRFLHKHGVCDESLLDKKRNKWWE